MQLDDGGLEWIEGGEIPQGLVESEDIRGSFNGYLAEPIEGQQGNVAASFFALPAPSMVDQDATHHTAGNAKEVVAILPIDSVLTSELQVGLVHQRCRLQRVVSALPVQMASSHLL